MAKHAQRLQDLADVQAEKSVIETRGPMTLPHAVPACCRGYKHILCVAKNTKSRVLDVVYVAALP